MGEINASRKVEDICNVELPPGFVVNAGTAVVNLRSNGQEDYYIQLSTDNLKSCPEALQKLEARKAELFAYRDEYGDPVFGATEFPVRPRIQICDEDLTRCGYEQPTLSEAVAKFATKGYDLEKKWYGGAYEWLKTFF